jgi:acyl-CoA reductase-like NAD-dependent aldehyde dehydrogenase
MPASPLSFSLFSDVLKMSPATNEELDHAIESAKAAFLKMRVMPRHTRHNILTRVSQMVHFQRCSPKDEKKIIREVGLRN